MKNSISFVASGYDSAAVQLFKDVDGVDALLGNCPVVQLTQGEEVPTSTNGDALLYVVLSGALFAEPVASTVPTEGEAAKTLKVLPGQCVGELAIFDGDGGALNISAGQASEVLVLETDQLWKLIDEAPGLARNLLLLPSFRNRANFAQLRRRQKSREHYRHLASIDDVTGLKSREWLDENLPVLLETAATAKKHLSILMIDIDHFEQFDEMHGPLAAVEALKTAANVLNGALRPTDFAARYSSKDMLVILPEANTQGATMVAQRLRERMQKTVVFADMRKPLPHITASFGVACAGVEQNADALVQAGIAALDRAKHSGRNCVSS